MSGQTPGQDDDGDASKSSSHSQQITTPLAGEFDTQESTEGDQEPTLHADEADARDLNYNDEKEEDEGEDDGNQGYDNSHVNDELPERPSSRQDFSTDEEGNTITFQQRRERYSRSPGLSHISEDSNETHELTSAAQGSGRQPATGSGIREDGPNDEGPDEKEPEAKGLEDEEPDDTQDDDTLADVAETRSRLFDSIIERIRDEGLYTNPQALTTARVMGTMPGEAALRWWNAEDLEARFLRTVEEFRQYNAQPRDDRTKLPVNLQNEITTQLQGLAYSLHGGTMLWLTQGLRSDTNWMMQMTDFIDRLLEDRPRAAPPSRAPSTGSNASGPERVLPFLDRRALRRRTRDDLVEMIIRQDDERRAEIDQLEADIEVATTQANAERDEAQADLKKLTDYTQQLRIVAHENGRNNRDLEGRPLQVERKPAGPTGHQQEDHDEYTDRIEVELDACNKGREKDAETIRHLRLEIVDLNASLDTAREDARLEVVGLNANLDNAREEACQALEQLHMLHQDGLNTNNRESTGALSGRELSGAPASEVSTNQDTTADRPPLKDNDAALEELRRDHRQELAQVRADYEKEINDLNKDIEDDQRRAQGNRQQSLKIDDEPLSGRESLEVSSSNQPAEGRESSGGSNSDNGRTPGVAPGLGDLLDSLWDDADASAELMAMTDQTHQQEQPGKAETDSAIGSAPLSPDPKGSPSESAERSLSAATANEARLQNMIQELTAANGTLRRRVNALEQQRDGATARTRQLEIHRNALQNALQDAIPRYEALQEQVAVLERNRTELQRALEENREFQQQQATDLERTRDTLQLHLASSQTAREADQDIAVTGPPTTEALRQRVDDLEAANRILRDQLATEQQRFADVDQERSRLQTMVDNDFEVYQGLLNDSSPLRFRNRSQGQALARTTRERDEAREALESARDNLENSEITVQAAEAERNQAVFELQDAEARFEEQTTTLQRAIEERDGSQQLLTDLRRQLRECQEHRAAQSSRPTVHDPEQADHLVDRLLQVINELRQFAPQSHEIAQFATIMVQTGRRAPAELEAELQRVTDLAENVRWPNADLDITPEQRGDPEQPTGDLEAWLRTVEAAIDDSVRLSAAVGSLRVAVELWNFINPPERSGSRGSLPADPGSERDHSQAGPPSSRASKSSTTSSANNRERDALLDAAAQVATQYAHDHPESPLNEAQRLILAGQAADLYLRRLMGEQSISDSDGEASEWKRDETPSLVTDGGDDVQSSSARNHSVRRPDRNRPLYLDSAWERVHPTGPCDDCVPVLRFPVAFFPGGVDPGPCRCGPADTIDPHIAESRSSGARSVAFSDGHGADDQNGPGGNTKFPQGILKKPRSIDTAKAKASRRAPIRSPYPRRARSLPAWNAAQLPSPRQTQRSQSTKSAGSRSSSPLPSRQLSNVVSVPITPVRKSCCEHFDELKHAAFAGYRARSTRQRSAALAGSSPTSFHTCAPATRRAAIMLFAKTSASSSLDSWRACQVAKLSKKTANVNMEVTANKALANLTLAAYTTLKRTAGHTADVAKHVLCMSAVHIG
ncbi:hypothetical protein N0V82_010399 [Gnomoniopsis sp. IMI 355080]|nr:hypothetical protein N0V82_010399 [Gnomoniopsis sp. IMI 355080]